jgi:hypothetical protein
MWEWLGAPTGQCHGFKADASQVSGELETMIDEIRESRPQASFD